MERASGNLMDDESLIGELIDLARQHDFLDGLHRVLFHPAFPVDIRHNSKIGREALTAWAREQTS